MTDLIALATTTPQNAIRGLSAKGTTSEGASRATPGALSKASPGAIAAAPPHWGADRPEFDPGAVADMRRRRNAEAAEIVVRRAEFLEPTDRALLRAVYADGIRIREVAALRSERGADDVAGSSARAVRRRIRALVSRVLSPTFTFVLANQNSWTPTRRRVAQAALLQGLTMRETAARTKTSLHSVRRHVDAVRTLAAEAGGRAS